MVSFIWSFSIRIADHRDGLVAWNTIRAHKPKACSVLQENALEEPLNNRATNRAYACRSFFTQGKEAIPQGGRGV